VVLPALSLTKLFIGNIHRRADAATVHEAIASVEPVRAAAGGGVAWGQRRARRAVHTRTRFATPLTRRLLTHTRVHYPPSLRPFACPPQGLVSVELFEESSGAAHVHHSNPAMQAAAQAAAAAAAQAAASAPGGGGPQPQPQQQLLMSGLTAHAAHGHAVAAAMAAGGPHMLPPHQAAALGYTDQPGPLPYGALPPPQAQAQQTPSETGSSSSGSGSAGGGSGGGGGFLHRGFCFAEFADHEAAHRALRALIDPGFTRIPCGGGGGGGGGSSSGSATGAPDDGAGGGGGSGGGLKVDWAEPLHEVSEVRGGREGGKDGGSPLLRAGSRHAPHASPRRFLAPAPTAYRAPYRARAGRDAPGAHPVRVQPAAVARRRARGHAGAHV
jgi:hypothetical protein